MITLRQTHFHFQKQGFPLWDPRRAPTYVTTQLCYGTGEVTKMRFLRGKSVLKKFYYQKSSENWKKQQHKNNLHAYGFNLQKSKLVSQAIAKLILFKRVSHFRQSFVDKAHRQKHMGQTAHSVQRSHLETIGKHSPSSPIAFLDTPLILGYP